MKKIGSFFILLAALILCVFLCGCGKEEPASAGNNINNERAAKNIQETKTADKNVKVQRKQRLNIPKIDWSSKILGLSEREIKLRKGNDLAGPDRGDTGFGSIMHQLCYISNRKNMKCYMDIEAVFPSYYGIVNGKVVVKATTFNNVLATIRKIDTKTHDLVTVKPLSYKVTFPDGTNAEAYLWETDDGFLSLTVQPVAGFDYRDYPVVALAVVSDLKYLGYFKK